jgi:hypothetical protein
VIFFSKKGQKAKKMGLPKAAILLAPFDAWAGWDSPDLGQNSSHSACPETN